MPESEYGWKNVWAPSAIPFADGYAQPLEMTLDDIAELKQAFVDCTKRALEAGFDVLELHFAHGYLVNNFLSPKSNQRTDQYGGNLENRLKLALELVKLVKETAPKEVAILVRITATEWDPAGEKDQDGNWQSWGIEQSIILAKELKKLGIDLLDVSSGGNFSGQKISVGPGYQVPLAEAIKKAVPDLPINSVGLITSGIQGTLATRCCKSKVNLADSPCSRRLPAANGILDAGKADTVMLAREMLRNADFVFDAANGTSTRLSSLL